MPHKDTSVANKQAISSTRTQPTRLKMPHSLQGHKHSYPTSYQFNQNTSHLALNAHRDTSVAFQQTINPGSKCHTGTQALLSNKLLVQCSKFYTGTQAQLYNNLKSEGMIPPEYKNRVSGLLSRSKQYGVTLYTNFI